MATINAATVYQSLMTAAMQAPTEREANEANSQRFNAALYLRNMETCTPHGMELEHHQAHDVTTDSGATWTDTDIADTHRAAICRSAHAAHSELMEGINDPLKVTIQTGERSRVKLTNTRERLQAFAEHVRKSQALYGGGIARTTKPRKAAAWPAASVRLVSELLQDDDYKAAAQLAEDKCGADFYHMTRTAFMIWAPQPVEGLPDGFMTARRSIDSKWVCMHQSGFSLAEANSRAAAERNGLKAWEFAGEAKQTAALARCAAMPHDQAAARAAFMEQHHIGTDDTAAQEVPEASEAPAAPAVAIVSAQTGATLCPVSHTVADLVASATAAAAIEQASTAAPADQHQAPELETVDCGSDAMDTTCEDASSARHSATLQQGNTSSTAAATWNNASEPERAAWLTGAGMAPHPAAHRLDEFGPAAQSEIIRAVMRNQAPATPATAWHRPVTAQTHIKSKSGEWSAAFYRNAAGAYVVRFESLADGASWHRADTAGQRARMLQELARAADAHQPPAAAQPGAPGGMPPAPAAAQQTAPVPSAADKVPQDLENGTGTTGAPPAAGAGRLQITITRAEGLADECGRPVTVASFPAADDLLRAWSETAPKTGGYDKCDFSISWPDGGTYAGRYDLKHHSAERPSLTRHMVDLAEFYTGANCPDHMAPSSYARHLQTISADTRAAYAAILDTLRTLGAYFPRARPVAADLVQALADGIQPAELVGLGVVYAGNMSDSSGTGAIVAAEPCHFYKLRLAVQLEDGRAMTVNANQFDGSGRALFRLDQRMHGAPYLAQLAAAVASKKASESAQKAAAEAEHARQLQALAAEFPQLQRPSDKNRGAKLAAANMRILLRAAFKGVKFSVTSERNSARVAWTDGPTAEHVNAIIGRFDIGASDTQTDYFYTVHTAFSELFGGVQYLNVNRHDSPELIARALADLYPHAATRPSVDDWQNARGAFDWRSDCDPARREFRQHLASLSTWSGKA